MKKNLSERSIDLSAGILLGIIIFCLWSFGFSKLRLYPPYYDSRQLSALDNFTADDLLRPLDFGGYYRWTPTGMLAVVWLDKNVFAPLANLEFKAGPETAKAPRLLPLYNLLFAISASLLYWLARFLGFKRPLALIPAVFFTSHKSLYFFMGNVSCLAASLLIIYGLIATFSVVAFYRTLQRRYLVGYYLSLALVVGAWEQCLNMLAALILFSGLLFLRKKINRRVFFHTFATPLIIALAYLAFRIPSATIEVSAVTEAQYVFSYPNIPMMIEEIISNSAYHISQIFDGVLFPWPMQSAAILIPANMDQINLYNARYAGPYGSVHYHAFGLFYAAFISALFIFAMSYTFKHLWGRPKTALDWAAIAAIIAIPMGFLVHLPIMHRTYFLMPGYFIGYKHSVSLVGAGIWLAWGIDAFAKAYKWRERKLWAVVCIFCLWLVIANGSKIALTPKEVGFPW